MKRMLCVTTCAVAIAASLCGCGGSTAEQRTRFELSVGAASALSGLPNDHGFAVTLTTAAIELGAVTFYSGAPLVGGTITARARRRRSTLLHRLARAARWLWPIGTAHAHPGHYQAGTAVAELQVGRRIDLTAGATRVGTALGVTGDYRSLSVAVGTVQIAGTARDSASGDDVAFRATVAVDKAIVGAPASSTLDPAPQVADPVVLTVDVAQWVRRIDFSAVRSTGSGRVDLEPGTQPYNALARGVFNAAAFTAEVAR